MVQGMIAPHLFDDDAPSLAGPMIVDTAATDFLSLVCSQKNEDTVSTSHCELWYTEEPALKLRA